MGLTPKQYADELIYRKILTTRYATGQVRYVRALVDKMTKEIVRYVLKKKNLDTKGQFNDARKFVRTTCLKYRDILYKYLREELRKFVKEQARWEYDNSPIKLKKVDIDRVAGNVFFEAFSDRDTIKSYVQRLFNQILQLWTSQLSIAYRTGQNLDEMVEFITGRGDW